MKNKVGWMIGGAQGSGVNSVAETFAKAVSRGGLCLFANIEYHSNIKGEHSYYRLRIDDHPVHSYLDQVDLLVALDKETIFGDIHKETPSHRGHRHEVSPGGGIVYDSEIKFTESDLGRPDVKLFPVPYKNLLFEALKDFGKEKELSTYQVMVNTIAFGASVGLLDYDFEIVADAVRSGFKGRKAHLAEMNVKVTKYGYDYVKDQFRDQFDFKLEKVPSREKRIVIRGVEAVAIAKFRAGCALQTYYPITPATDESVYLESHQKDYSIMVVQAEDEIAAINMCTGAAHAGVRAATSTSGPGFSLMAEGLGWAGNTESPGPVITYYQRPGPATGLPTRTEQGDMRFALHAAHGEFPRIIVASGDMQEAYYDTFDAFNLAERYQVPVIVMLDKYLASSYGTMEIFDGHPGKVDRGLLLKESDLANLAGYDRYAFTELGISPRSIPGERGGIFWMTGDEHDTKGHIAENADIRTKMMDKRMRKLLLAAEEVPDEKKINAFGPPDAEVTLTGWGSTKGAIFDAIAELGKDGITTNFLQVRYLNPFPTDLVTEYLAKAKLVVDVENNYSGQLAGLIRERTGIGIDHKMVKYNGRPFSQNEVMDGVKEILEKGTNLVVMNRG